jgi:hypothetical protein
VRRLAQQQLFEAYRIADDLLADRDFLFDLSPPSMPISSGAFDAACNSASIFPDSGRASRISSG